MGEEDKAMAIEVPFTKEERFIVLRFICEMNSSGLDEIETRIAMKAALVADWDWPALRKTGLKDDEVGSAAVVSLSPKVGVSLREFIKEKVLPVDRPLDLQEVLFSAFHKLGPFGD